MARLGDPLAREGPARSFWRDAWSRLRLNRAAMVGLVVISCLGVAAVLAPWLAPYDYADGNLLRTAEGPSRDHLLGTDEVGRDILSRLRTAAGFHSPWPSPPRSSSSSSAYRSV
jgi:ABC-type dipeptide/oligopeptide/nickel transport system permease subunit